MARLWALIIFKAILSVYWTLSISNGNGEDPNPYPTNCLLPWSHTPTPMKTNCCGFRIGPEMAKYEPWNILDEFSWLFYFGLFFKVRICHCYSRDIMQKYNFKALFGSCRKKKKKTILNVNLAKIFLETVMDLNQWSSYSTKFLTLRVCLDRTYFAETENWKLKTL